jgi:hypothetical protein
MNNEDKDMMHDTTIKIPKATFVREANKVSNLVNNFDSVYKNAKNEYSILDQLYNSDDV